MGKLGTINWCLCEPVCFKSSQINIDENQPYFFREVDFNTRNKQEGTVMGTRHIWGEVGLLLHSTIQTCRIIRLVPNNSSSSRNIQLPITLYKHNNRTSLAITIAAIMRVTIVPEVSFVLIAAVSLSTAIV